jgi:dephospho-CoA kinase
MGVVLGITGGVATGKTTVTELFRKLGARTVSADEIARQVIDVGMPAADEVAREFGPRVITPDGSIDRGELARIVFRDPEARRKLDAITHPRIIRILEERVRAFRESAAEGDVLAVEIPLLIECGLQWLVDKVIVVAAEQETQMSRLTTRGFSTEEASLRIAAQAPIEEKMRVADWVIRTDGDLDETERQVERVWEQVKGPVS